MPTLNNINNIYIGTKKISSICLGDELIWKPPTYYITFHSYGEHEITLSTSGYDSDYDEDGDNLDYGPVLYYKYISASIYGSETGWIRWRYKNAIYLPNGASFCVAGINPKGISHGNNANGHEYESENFSMFVIQKLTNDAYVECSGSIMSLIDPYTNPDNVQIPCSGCFAHLFGWCNSLRVAPELSASQFKPYCYYGMFENCTSLQSITCKCKSTEYRGTATKDWVRGVSSSGTFYAPEDVINDDMLWTTGNSGIPTGWTVETFV